MRGIESMAYPLPEDIQVRVHAGDFKGALGLIDIYIREGIAPLLNQRLELEKQRMERMSANYPYTRLQAINMAQVAIPELTDAEFDEMELRGDIQYMYIDGQKRYFESFLSSLYRLRPDMARRAGTFKGPKNELLDAAIAEIKQNGVLSYRMHICASLEVNESAFQPGDYRVHLPLPAISAQQSDIRIIAASDDLKSVCAEDAPVRTAYFERHMDSNAPFFVEYEYTNTVKYFSMDMPAPAEPLYPSVPAPDADDLAELPGHIMFTPYLRALAADICKDETDPLKKARLIYDYVTTHVRYSLMREYFLLPPIAEYVATGLKGDCGVQALLFITLCRISGIPARWQSGLSASLTEAGSHDWAQFYAPGWGWLFADCSFGGGALANGSRERWNYYFGNLDPFRMVANSRFQARMEPEKKFPRNDPYDNQSGECENERKRFSSDEINCERKVVKAEKLL